MRANARDSPRPNPKSRYAERSKWSSYVESATLSLDVSSLTAAKKAFRALPLEERARLAFEVARTRRREFCLAYENVIMVTSGRKHRDGYGRSDTPRILKSPCVIFVVRKKWNRTPRGAVGRLQMLPSFIAAYWTIDGHRTLCAVPTDVIAADRFRRARSEASTGVSVAINDGNAAEGNFACVVEAQLPDGTSQEMMLSCLHVFSPIPKVNAKPAAGLMIRRLSAASDPELGRSSAIGGRLFWFNDQPSVAHSFDVQLATITHRDRVLAAQGALQWSTATPVLDGKTFYERASRGDRFQFLVPSSGSSVRKVRGEYVHDHPPESPIEYEVTIAGEQRTALIHPEWALNFRFIDDTTMPGDSGSPVVHRIDAQTYALAGMHIAITEAGYAVVIPAWQLFQTWRYKSTVTQLKPVIA